ncbi:MAG TPA: sialidase family protein [Mycobacteriales bacterium]|nr:sialidase family protein [Mycobacteriales bacterium]
MKAFRAGTILALACALPVLGASVATAAPAPAAAQVLFSRDTGGYECFRIPALIQAADNSLLAFAEARKPLAGGSWCADAAPIDTVVRRSTDHGKTWGAASVVLSGSPDGSTAGATRGNPEPILVTRGKHRGRIVLLTTYNPAGGGVRIPFAQHSDDNGRTWSTATDLGSQLKPANSGWFATGPAHGIQLRHGAHAGRLLAGVNYDDSNGLTHGAIAHSDDGGDSWQLGADALAPDQNHQFGELSVVEANDGTVTAIARNKVDGDMTQSRMSAVSTDGGSSFTAAGFTPVPDLGTTPGVQGASLLVDRPGRDGTMFFSSPVDSALRKNMTIFASRDAGATWRSVDQVTTDRSGYSDMTQIGANELGVLYEAGAYPSGDARDEIRFNLLSLGSLR